MTKHYEKGSRNFVVRFYKKEKTVFIGTAGLLSDLAAQALCHELMSPLKWKPTGTCIDLPNKDGIYCAAVGYKVPFWTNPRKKIDKLFNN